MVEESLLYHAVMVKILLGFLIINLIIPLFSKESSISAIKVIRVGSFTYSALLTMVIFTGMILYMLGKVAWNIEMSLMVVVSILLSIIEIIRVKKVKREWMANRSMKKISSIYIFVEIVILSMTIVKTMDR
jgi:hypothetical protein